MCRSILIVNVTDKVRTTQQYTHFLLLRSSFQLVAIYYFSKAEHVLQSQVLYYRGAEHVISLE